MKCSFCDAALQCKACGQLFRPKDANTHRAIYQPDMQIYCPACRALLKCKWCGFVYGEEDEEPE